jgi:hypothetical protein
MASPGALFVGAQRAELQWPCAKAHSEQINRSVVDNLIAMQYPFSFERFRPIE